MIPKMDSAISIFRAAASRTVPQDVCTLHTTTQHYSQEHRQAAHLLDQASTVEYPLRKKKRQSSGGNLIPPRTTNPDNLISRFVVSDEVKSPLFFFWTERLASSSIEKCQMSERAHLLCRHVLSSYLLYSLPPISHFKVFVFNVLFKKLKNISHI